MNITRISIEGYRSYGNEVSIDFSTPGLVLLTGENRDRGVSSAAGKSTIFKALCCALFEENDDDSVKDRGINSLRSNLGYRIAVEFSDDRGDAYSVVYARKHHSDGTHWTLFRWDGTFWKNLSEEKNSDTKLVIQRIIGMTYTQFANTSYMQQQRIAQFIWSTDKERKALFSHVMGLEECDRYIDTVRTWRRDSEKLLQEGRGKLAVLTSQLRAAESTLVSPSEVTTKKTISKQHQESIANIDLELKKKRDDLAAMQAITKLLNDKKTASNMVDHFRAAKAKLPSLREYSAEYSYAERMEMSRAVLQRTTTKSANIQADMEVIHKSIRKMQAIGNVCIECDQQIPAGYREKKLEALLIASEELDVKRREIASILDAYCTEYNQVCDKAKEEAAIQQEHARITLEVLHWEDKLNEVQKKIEEVSQVFGDINVYPDAIAKEISDLHTQRSNIVQQKALLDVQIERAQMAKTAHDTLIANKAAQEHDNSEYEEALEYLKKIDDLLGDKGFKNHKIASSRVAFNNSLSEYLSGLTDGEVSAELVTKIPRSDGKGFKEEVDILVSDGAKKNVSLRQYSGGEQTTLSIAITGAFCDLAATQSGVGSNLLLLDEPFGALDTAGEEKTCAMLETMRGQGRTIIVVTNRNGVRDRGVFDREIRAIKEGHVTTLEEYNLQGEH